MDATYFRQMIAELEDAKETVRYTAETLIPEILLNVERAALRGQTLSPDWFVRQLVDLEAELLAVL